MLTLAGSVFFVRGENNFFNVGRHPLISNSIPLSSPQRKDAHSFNFCCRDVRIIWATSVDDRRRYGRAHSFICEQTANESKTSAVDCMSRESGNDELLVIWCVESERRMKFEIMSTTHFFTRKQDNSRKIDHSKEDTQFLTECYVAEIKLISTSLRSSSSSSLP